MNAIIIEGVLFIALVCVAVALVVFVVRYYTAAGRVLEQTRNRKAIDRAMNLTCALHGEHEEREMVRLESGEVMCPECYREAVDGRP
ncbi:MAG TPA: hypothetical protein VFW03_21195 [Gemmatimonadaceae bacterium]|nr:hypothetical protein [Gemmatimonadaceae bacterium]